MNNGHPALALVAILVLAGCGASSSNAPRPASHGQAQRTLGGLVAIEPVAGLPTVAVRLTNRSDGPLALAGEVYLSANAECGYAEAASTAAADETGSCFTTMSLLHPGQSVIIADHAPFGDPSQLPTSGTCIGYSLCLQALNQPIAVNYRGFVRLADQ